MKRLNGGLVLLNLSDISLGITAGEVSITDAGVLSELTELRNFIDVNRDFSKGFKNLKPVLIEYRSSASKFNGIALGNLSFNTDALHMSIGINTIQSDGKMLIVTINVVYEWVDYVGYQVKTAKLNAYETLASGDGTFTGDVGVGGDFEVTGDVTGTFKAFESIADSSGHKRFIEDEIECEEITGITPTYARWSLSGSHLMIVIAFNVADTTVIASNTLLCSLSNIPQWIIDKIYPIYSTIVSYKTLDYYNNVGQTQSSSCYIQKTDPSTLVVKLGGFTLTADRLARIQFDLLIDNAE